VGKRSSSQKPSPPAPPDPSTAFKRGAGAIPSALELQRPLAPLASAAQALSAAASSHCVTPSVLTVSGAQAPAATPPLFHIPAYYIQADSAGAPLAASPAPAGFFVPTVSASLSHNLSHRRTSSVPHSRRTRSADDLPAIAAAAPSSSPLALAGSGDQSGRRSRSIGALDSSSSAVLVCPGQLGQRHRSLFPLELAVKSVAELHRRQSRGQSGFRQSSS